MSTTILAKTPKRASPIPALFASSRCVDRSSADAAIATISGSDHRRIRVVTIPVPAAVILDQRTMRTLAIRHIRAARIETSLRAIRYLLVAHHDPDVGRHMHIAYARPRRATMGPSTKRSTTKRSTTSGCRSTKRMAIRTTGGAGHAR